MSIDPNWILPLPFNLPTATTAHTTAGSTHAIRLPLPFNLPALVTATKVLITANPAGVVINSPFSLTVNATDVSNNVALGYSGSATVTKASGPGTLSGTTTASFSGGVLTFSNLLVDVVGSYTLTISSGALTPATTISFSVAAYTTYITEPFTFSGNLNGHVSNGYTWTETTPGTFVADGTKLVSSGWASGNQFALLDIGLTSYYAKATIKADFTGIVFRYVDANNYWRVDLWNGSGLYLFKFVGGVQTTVYRWQSPTLNNVAGVAVSGNTITMYFNDVPIFTTTDSAGAAATKIGFYANSNTKTYDDLIVTSQTPTALVTSPVASDSDAFTRADASVPGATVGGLLWHSTRPNIAGIVSNQLSIPTTGDQHVFVGTGDGTVSIVPTSGQGGVHGRLGSNSTGWPYGFAGALIGYHPNGKNFGVHAANIDGGFVGRTVGMCMNGPRLTWLYDGTPIARFTDTTGQTNGWQGIHGEASSPTLDNWAWSTDVTKSPTVSGGSVNTALVVFDGDSQTAGAGVTSSPANLLSAKALNDYGAAMDVLVTAVAGYTLLQCESAAAGGSGWRTFLTGVTWATGKRIVFIWAGTNDIATGSTGATAYSRLQTYCTNSYANGADIVVIITCMDRSTGSPYNTERQAYNTSIRGGWTGSGGSSTTLATNVLKIATSGSGKMADYLLDVGNDTNLGATGAYTNTTYFSGDQIHLNSFGTAYLYTNFVQKVFVDQTLSINPTTWNPVATVGGSTVSQTVTVTATGAWTATTSSTGVSLTGASGTGNGSFTAIYTPAGSAGTSAIDIAVAETGATTVHVTGTATTNAGATATHLAFSQQPVATGKTIAFTTMPKVQALLAGGGVDTSYTANVTLGITSGSGGTAGAGATLSGTVTVACVAGVADFTSANLSINQGGTGFELHATSGALTAADSSAFDVASVYADFNGTDSSTLLINPATGQTWTAQVGTFKNISNQAKLDTGSEGQATVSAGSANGYSQVTIVNATSTDGGLLYRYQDSTDFWLIRNLGGNTDFYLRSGGSYSLQAQVAGSANGDVIKAVYNGSSHTIYRNGTSIATLTDSTFSTQPLVGIRGNSGTVLWDDFKTVPA